MNVRFWFLVIVVCTPCRTAGGAFSAEAGEGRAVQPAPKRDQTPNQPDLAQAVKSVIRQTNEFREKEGLVKVTTNSKLNAAAQALADHMARTDKFGHTVDGDQPGDRAKKQGYDYCVISENIAYQQIPAGFATETLARRFIETWKRSPDHRKNMLDPDVTEIGSAIAQSRKSGRFYAVQVFGRPKSAAIEFTVTSQTAAQLEYQIGERTFTLMPRQSITHRSCRSTKIKFRWPGPEGGTDFIKAGNRDRLVVVEENGIFRVKKE